jgi:hypothetical protein
LYHVGDNMAFEQEELQKRMLECLFFKDEEDLNN